MKRVFYSFWFTLAFLLPISCEDIDLGGITNTEAIAGLKQALQFGSDSAAGQLSKVNGYFGNQALKILLPTEAQPIIDNINLIPGGQALLDEVVLRINRGAEQAASEAAPIFLNAITTMTISDGFAILKGSDSAATAYLRSKTYTGLTSTFKPKIQNAMQTVGAATAWNSLFTKYNTIALPIINLVPGNNLKPVNPDLSQYATDRALSGLFTKVREQEILIRKDPARRVTDLLKKVFAEQDK